MSRLYINVLEAMFLLFLVRGGFSFFVVMLTLYRVLEIKRKNFGDKLEGLVFFLFFSVALFNAVVISYVWSLKLNVN